MCEQLRKREVNLCYLREVRWRGQEARFVGCRSRKYKLWWSENNDRIGVEILVKNFAKRLWKSGEKVTE